MLKPLAELVEVERLYSKEFGRSIEALELGDGRDPNIVLNYKTIFPYPKSTDRSFLFRDPSLEQYYYRLYLSGIRKDTVDIIKDGKVISMDEMDSFNGEYEFYSTEKLLRIEYLSFKDGTDLLNRVSKQLLDSKRFTIIKNGFENKKNVRYFKSISGANLTIYTIKGLVEYNTLRKYYGDLSCFPFSTDIDRNTSLYCAFTGDDSVLDMYILKAMLDIEEVIQDPFNYIFRLNQRTRSTSIIV